MDNKVKEDIIFKIGNIRNKANLSARKLSIAIGNNDGYINRLESKRDFLPSMEAFFDILDACGTTAEEFFYHSPNDFKTDMEILKLFKQLNDKQRQGLISLLEDFNTKNQ